AVLGFNMAQALFPDGNAVNRTFMMDGAEYTVVGVFEKAKGGFFGENAQDVVVEIPMRTAVSRYPNVDRYMITAKAQTGMRKDAFEEVRALIRRTRRLNTDAPDDFALSTPDQI